MGEGSVGYMGCEVQKPLCRCTFVYAVIFLVATLIWFGFCAGGLDKLPKCRYGENDCFWHPSASICDSTFTYCMDQPSAGIRQLIKVKLEGSSDNVSEQLAIPVTCMVLSWIPALCFFFDRCFSDGSTKALETAKWFTVGALCLWMFSLYIVQKLTFNGRWWNQSTQDSMKEGYGLFCVGAIGNICCEMTMLYFAVTAEEEKRLPGGLNPSSGSPRSTM